MPRTRKKKFSLYNKPRRPVKPSATLPSNKPVSYIQLTNTYHHELTDEQKEVLATASKLSVYDVYYEDDTGASDITLGIFSEIEVPNPRFDEQMEKYKTEYAQYREDLKWWNEEKKKYDEERKAEQEKQERETLAKLLQKYGPEMAQEDVST